MSRIMALDLGLKRTGIAVTDPLKIISTALDTIESTSLITYLKSYFLKEKVEKIVVGYPIDLNSKETHGTAIVKQYMEKLKNEFPDIEIIPHDERFTSKMALQSMISAGYSKKDRRQKGNIDKVSAVIILNSYLGIGY